MKNSRNDREFDKRSNRHDLRTSVRSTTAEATLCWLQPKLSSFGITRISDITGLDRIGIPVAIAMRPMAKSVSVSQGKGISLNAAMVSAAMESIEVWHAENLSEASITTNSGETPTGAFVSLDSLGLADHDSHETSLTQRWHRAVDIMTSRELLIPREALSISTLKKKLNDAASATTNGLASGNSYVEAVCHSAFEIAERDAFAKWFELGPQRRAKTSIDLDTVDDFNASLLRLIARAGLSIRIFDLREGGGIWPAYAANIWGSEDYLVDRPYTGRGAHISASIALSRAITEAAQSRLSMISGSRDDNFEEDYHLLLENQQAAGSLPFLSTSDSKMNQWFQDPMEFTRVAFEEGGYKEWIVYDHTRPEYGIPVVHTFIPKMKDIRVI